MKIRFRNSRQVAHAELRKTAGLPALVYFETLEYHSDNLEELAAFGGEPIAFDNRGAVMAADVEAVLPVDQASDWELVLADDTERRLLKEAGYVFN